MKKYCRFQILQQKEKILSCLFAQKSHSIQEAIFSSCFLIIKKSNWMHNFQNWSAIAEFSVKNKEFEVDPNIREEC